MIKCINTSIIYSENGNKNAVHTLAHDDRKMVTMLDKEGISGAILTDLPKAFDCTLHDLLIPKLAAYGFDYQPLRIMESSLSNRHQRTKINNVFSHYSELYTEFHNGQLWALYISISISVTYFLT